MKTILLTTVALVTLTLSSCGPSAEQVAMKEKLQQQISIAQADVAATTKAAQEMKQANTIADFTKSFEGTIAGKYGILMTLTKNGNDLSGTYMYKSQNSSLKINGSIDNNGNLSLNEFDNKGSITGILKGQLSGGNIIGQWNKPDGSKTMPFSVFESSNTEAQLLKEKKEEGC